MISIPERSLHTSNEVWVHFRAARAGEKKHRLAYCKRGRSFGYAISPVALACIKRGIGCNHHLRSQILTSRERIFHAADTEAGRHHDWTKVGGKVPRVDEPAQALRDGNRLRAARLG